MRRNSKIGVLILLLLIISSNFYRCSIRKGKVEDDLKTSKQELEGEITFVSNRTDKKEEIEAVIKEFEELNPKVNIELELIGDVEEILQRKASVGDLPDITLVPGAIRISEYHKYFLPLDDLGFTKENIYNYASGVGSDGKLYNVDTTVGWSGVIYHKRVFEEAGINEIPRTIDEFFEACKKIKLIGKIPVILNYKQTWTMGSWIDSMPYLFDKDIEKKVLNKGNSVLDEDNGIFKSLNLIRNIVQNKYCEEDLLNYEWEQCKHDLSRGEAGMFFYGSNFLYQLEELEVNKDDLGIFPIPDTERIGVYGDYKVAISNKTKYPEVAREFFKFLFKEERYSKAVNILSPLKDNEENKKFFEEIKKYNLEIDIHGDNIKFGKDYVNVNHEKYDRLRRLTGLNYSFVQDYVVSNDVEELTNDLNDRWNELKDKDILE